MSLSPPNRLLLVKKAADFFQNWTLRSNSSQPKVCSPELEEVKLSGGRSDIPGTFKNEAVHEKTSFLFHYRHSYPCLHETRMRYQVQHVKNSTHSLGGDVLTEKRILAFPEYQDIINQADVLIVYCDLCLRKLQKESKEFEADIDVLKQHDTSSDIASNLRSRCWYCTKCGAPVHIVRVNNGSLLNLYDIDFSGRKKRGSIRRRINKLHKGLKSKIGMTPEVPETLEEREGEERNQSGVPPQPSSGGLNLLLDDNECDVGARDVTELHNAAKEDQDDVICQSNNNTKDTISTSLNRKDSSSIADESASTQQQEDSVISPTETSLHSTDTEQKLSTNNISTSSTRQMQNSDPTSISVTYKPSAGTLFLPLEHTPPTLTSFSKSPGSGSHKSNPRKKKRSASWYNVLNPSYKQKNVDFHKFFKKLPETERLLVDHSCALMKDILVQGRMYVSQNYVCFHSNILKWQTAVMLSFKDIVSLTKEKTVKLFPNAIQFQIKGRVKHTFTSFTSRDRAYHQIFRLWQNALLDKPMTPHELWGVVRNQYGSDLGCSSDDDYVRPNGVFDYRGVADFATPTEEIYKFGTTNKIQRNKYSQPRHTNNDVTDGRQMTSEADNLVSISDRSSEGDKSLSGCSLDDGDVVDQIDDDSGPAEFGLPDFNRTYLVREYECSAAELFNIIYGDTCPFWKLYLEKRQTFDITITKWKDGEAENQGYKVRSLNYNLTLNNPLGPKSSNVDEVQVCYKHEPCRYYTVDCTAHTHGVPYSDYFSTVMRYQIRKLGKSTCELRVSAQLVFNKTPWGLVKNFIEKNCYSGIEENFQMLEPELDSYVLQLNEKRKQTSESPVREYARQRISISSSGGRRRQSNKSSLESSPTIADTSIRNGDVTRDPYDVGKGDVIGAPTTTSPAAPEWDVNNNNHGKINREINGKKNGRFFKVVMTFVFAVLLLSNYSLYSRLNSLEQSNSIRVFDDVTTLHTKLIDGE
uniref:GRAM domain-containing protein 1C isoform X1 n=1 Tax=Ciona intestinalis TaxID=7719 RepID=UPI000EF4F7EF|nr:GRAM domain-containing protein 1C isoform X1 [Ciona intestinalis]|eukprot:XP_026693590.1 GRAM domain-containing protein 1C isoform X1 [Ciona intestinalis]